MSFVEVELANQRDLLTGSPVRRVRVRVIMDPSQVMTALPEELVDRLGLQDRIADWRHSGRPIADGLCVVAGGRSTVTNFLVLSAGETAVVGQTVVRALDLVVDEATQRLVPHPESPKVPRVRV